MPTTKEKQHTTKMSGEEMMKKYMELGNPGAEHQLLSQMEGKWITKSKTWMEPGAAPTENTGSSEGKMILGGRYLAHMESSDMGGMPYMGMGVIGFDNHTKKFVSTWYDNFGTSILYFEEKSSGGGKPLMMEACHMDKFQGPVTYRTIEKDVDNDHYTLELYMIGKDRKEFKMMETLYTRSK
jgi:hypothetical protein